MGHGAAGFGKHLGFGLPGDVQGLAGRTVVAAMVGGLSSRLTGGSFANGAVTAAFVHLFNAESVSLGKIIDSTSDAVSHYYFGNGKR